MKKFLVSLLLGQLFFSVTLIAQNEANVWYFGAKFGLDFSSGTAQKNYNSNMTAIAGSASICDSSGNLLFYTNGETVFNKNHDTMQNGKGLNGDTRAAQSALIVNHELNKNLYYIFTNDCISSKSSSKGLQYSVVDITLNGGLGAVISKNNLLYANSVEKMAAVYHANCGDIWVTVKDQDSNKFCSFRLTAAGVIPTPAVSYGTPGGRILPTEIGVMKFSPDGSMLAMGNNKIHLYSFDVSTGKVYNEQVFDQWVRIPPLGIVEINNVYGLEFSPNSKYLYFGPDHPFGSVMRLDVSSRDIVLMHNSIRHVFIPPPPNYNTSFQLTPSSEILVRMGRGAISNILLISNPDNDSIAYGYTYVSSMIIDNGRISPPYNNLNGLPNFFGGYVNKPIIVTKKDKIHTRNFCEGDTVHFEAELHRCSDSILWEFGDPASGNKNFSTNKLTGHIYSSSGTYSVKLSHWHGTRLDVVYDTIVIKPNPIFSLGADTTICSSQSVNLIIPVSFDSLRWLDGNKTKTIYTADTAGVYWATVFKNGCTATDSIKLAVQNPPKLNLGNDTVICRGQVVNINATIPSGKQYIWNDGVNGAMRVITNQDEYSVIADDGVCEVRDTISIGVYVPQTIDLGGDTNLCEATENILNVTINSGKYIWNDGNTSPVRTITKSGTYTVQVSDSVCVLRDTIEVQFLKVPELNLNDDTTLCFGSSYFLQASPGFNNYLWTDGITLTGRIITTEGKYKVRGSFLNCYREDSILINYYPELPDIDLGSDTLLCKDVIKRLQVNITNGYGIIWSNGSNKNYIDINAPGTYLVSTLPHICGNVTDSIKVDYLDAPCHLFVPSAFTPNADGVNDVFIPMGYGTELLSMQIFNRWGELIYSGTEGWDGTYKDEAVPGGIYVYVIMYTVSSGFGERKLYAKGTVQVLR